MKELATALAAAQGELQNATLNRENSHYKSKYADLAAIRDAIIPVFSKHGLAVVHLTNFNDGQMVLITRLLHKSGEYLDSHYPVNADPLKPQAIGSALTYAKRYSLAGIGCISAEDDDDANEAEKHPKKPVKAPNEQPKAASRPVFTELQNKLRDFTDLGDLHNWFLNVKKDTSVPRDWLHLLFIEFVKQGLSISPGDGASSEFKKAWSKEIQELSDDERQGIEDAVAFNLGNAA